MSPVVMALFEVMRTDEHRLALKLDLLLVDAQEHEIHA
jgi:hypothetical protein